MFESILKIFKTEKQESLMMACSFYDLTCSTIDGEIFDFSLLKGKKVLIVNVASRCGHTPQYEDLEKLYQEFMGDNFIILGFPSNDFFRQESGSNAEIKAFCQLTYGVTFPMMSKVKVKGANIHPVYQWLTTMNLNGVMNSKVKWNFQKYLVSNSGELAGIVDPDENPFSQKILDFIKS